MAQIKRKTSKTVFNVFLGIFVAISLLIVFFKSGNPFAVLLVGTVLFVLIKIIKTRS